MKAFMIIITDELVNGLIKIEFVQCRVCLHTFSY